MSNTPLPTTGPVSFSQFPTAFAAPAAPANPVSFSQYTRGGSYIPINDSTLAAVPTTANSTRSVSQYRGLSRATLVATYSLTWAFADTYYGYCDVYTNGRIELRQEVWCPHSNIWWAQKRTQINLWNNAASLISMGQLVDQDPYANKQLAHTGSQMVLRNNGVVLAAVNAPLSL